MQGPVAIIHTQIGPYHLARIRAFRALYSGSVHLLQLASQEAQRQWTVDAAAAEITTVAQGTLEKLSPQAVSRQLIQCLTQINPAVIVVAGYSQPAMRVATHWARQHHTPTILLSDSQMLDHPRNLVKESLKGWWICRHFDAAFVAGASAAHYLSQLGFPRDRIWRSYDVVDNFHFAQGAATTRASADELRRQLGLSNPYFLYVGRFSPEKNLFRLLVAYQLYSQQAGFNAWSLVLLGSGPQQDKLQRQAAQLQLRNVFWFSFKQVDELPMYYGLASALILPSISEPWGLVVNEAMACGVPILISDRCGCIPDLVFPGINGWIFNPLLIANISKAMLRISAIPEHQLVSMGTASKRIIANYTPDIWAQALKDCVQTLVD